MNMTVALWVLIAIAILVGVIAWVIVVAIRRESARNRALVALAPELGLALVNGNGELRLDAFHFGTHLLAQGRAARASNAMEGTAAGLRTVLFDYHYESGSGEEATSIALTVAAFATPKNQFPPFVLKKRGLFSRLSWKKVEIPGDPEFSKRFALTGSDEATIQRVFGPGLTGFLVSTKLEDNYQLEAAGQWLVLFGRNGRLQPERWRSFLEETSQIASGFFQNCGAAETAKAG